MNPTTFFIFLVTILSLCVRILVEEVSHNIFVLDSLNSTENVNFKLINKVFESNSVVIDINALRLLVVLAIYRCHSSSFTTFNGNINTHILTKIRPKDKCIFLGDFKIYLFNPRRDPIIDDLYNMMLTKDLLPVISKPTRLSGNNKTLIDHIWTNLTIPYHTYTIESNISDHFLIALIFPALLIKNKIKVTFRNLSDESLSIFKN